MSKIRKIVTTGLGVLLLTGSAALEAKDSTGQIVVPTVPGGTMYLDSGVTNYVQGLGPAQKFRTTLQKCPATMKPAFTLGISGTNIDGPFPGSGALVNFRVQMSTISIAWETDAYYIHYTVLYPERLVSPGSMNVLWTIYCVPGP